METTPQGQAIPFIDRLRAWARSQANHPIRSAFAVAGLVAVIVLMVPNHYVTETRLLPISSASFGGAGSQAMSSATAALGISMPGQDSSDLTYQDILKSRWLRKKLVNATYDFTTHPFAYFKRQHHETLYQFLKSKNMDRALRTVDKMFSVKRDLRSKMITITVETESAELSQQIAVNATRALEEFNKEKNQTRGSNKARFTAERLTEAERAYAAAEMELRTFTESHKNYQTSAEPSVRLKGLRLENDLRLAQQRVTTLTLNHEQALIEEKNDLPILNVLDPGDAALEKSFPPRSMIVLAVFLGTLGICWYVAKGSAHLKRSLAARPQEA